MSSIKILAKQFALHNRLFSNVLEDINDKQGGERLSDQVNHLQWIAGHLTNSRYNYTPMLGLQLSFPYKKEYTDETQPPPNNRAISTSVNYPSLTEIQEYWNKLGNSFVESVANLNEEQQSAPLPFRVPIGGNTMLDLFAFLATHEAYHIGQMSIIRKHLGLSAMSYK
ncbi:MAG: DinB family protein [Bacteroidetes bacterium]|nr:DinB family protein [Bacteroidota bacterium]